ncbi:MAG: hypothetical protein NTY55_01305 [Flavobacteriia bacterium]|nr:hypothetical protein [Flavobacteriia bacterium]
MGDLLSAISVFLIFLMFLFNSIGKEVEDTLATRKPEDAQADKLNRYKTDLKQLLFLKSLPITLIFVISFYVLLPKTLTIIKTSKIDFWNFNELKTLFVFIEIGVFGLTSYATIKTFQLYIKLKDI